MGSLRVGHDWVTSLSLSCIGEGNGNPLQCSCLENPRDSGTWWAAVYGVTQSRTRLMWLSNNNFNMSTFLKKWSGISVLWSGNIHSIWGQGLYHPDLNLWQTNALLLQCSSIEQTSKVGSTKRNIKRDYSPWGHKELDTTEWLTLFGFPCWLRW